MTETLSLILKRYGSGRLAFWCPGCKSPHAINCGEARGGPAWGWNGSIDRPTFTPSVLVTCGRRVDATFVPEPGDPTECCHSFVTDGRIRFLDDCTHGLAGQTVDLPERPGMTETGVIVGNDPANYTAFASWLGRKPPMTLLAFNQSDPGQLASSVPWIVGQGVQFMALGAEVLWSVPCPGAGQLEAIRDGVHNALYRDIAHRIAAIDPNPLVRLPWEFNLRWQANAAVNKAGAWDGPLFVLAWRKLALIFREVGARIVWCPNVNTMDYDPALCLPGAAHYDIVAQDFYMQKAWNKAGDFNWFRDERRGLAWGRALAGAKGKGYGLSEWGMDDDRFAADMKTAAAWVKASVTHHHCWWNRGEDIDCRLDTGARPAIGAAYRAAFG